MAFELPLLHEGHLCVITPDNSCAPSVYLFILIVAHFFVPLYKSFNRDLNCAQKLPQPHAGSRLSFRFSYWLFRAEIDDHGEPVQVDHTPDCNPTKTVMPNIDLIQTFLFLLSSPVIL